MEVNDHGYRFFTVHNEFGDTAQVNGHFQRFQTQAPILPNQSFALDFYGRGSSIELLVTTLPRRATPQQRVALQREKLGTGTATNGLPPLSGAATLSNSVSVTHRADAPRGAEAIRAAALARARSAASAAVDSAPPSPPDTPGVMAFQVGPKFNSPFDIDFLDGWGLEPPPFPPPDLPPGGGGGGGGGLFHSAVRLELFVLGSDQPIETWELPEGIDSRFRSVKYEPQGFPTPDAPVRRTTWFRVVATPLGFDPVEIFVGANTRIADVPIRTTSLGVRLTDHLFRVGLEALMLDVSVSGSTARLALGRELTEMLGVEQVFEEKNIGPATSNAKLRSLKITSIGGTEFHALALQKYGERADKVTIPNQNLTREQKMAVLFKTQLARLAEVKDQDICIRIEAAFCKAAVAVWGLDIAKLNGELGEFVITFDRRMNRLRAFSFLDVDLSAIGSIAKAVVDLFTSVPTDVNKIIEDAIEKKQQDMLKYLKAFLARAMGASNVVYEAWFQDKAWKIRNSADPVIPRPGQVVRPPIVGGAVLDGGILEILSLADALGELEPADVPEAGPAEPSPAPPPPAPAGSGARELPPEFLLTPGEQLARLDRHQSIVVVMMENRSYDHMLGDLMHMRPDPQDPYDGAPFGVKTAGVHGFITGVPLVRARDLRLGTAIAVDPRHSFKATTFQMGDGTEQGSGTGDMLGFARDLYRRSDSPQQAMTVYSEADLPTYYKLADEFCTCERWFAAHPGPTWPNRFATLMGSIPELENFHMDDPRIGYLEDRNIFDALNGAGVDWRLFESDVSIIRMFDRFRLDSTNVVPIDDKEVGLEATLRQGGPLPRVMFIEPNFADIPPVKTADDDHPPADIAHGQKFISRICDLIWDSGRFGQVLLVITYDEHGGFYDHVPPPGTARGEQRSIARLHPDGPEYLGVRVPAFVVSPFVSAGAKSRTVFDHTSILKTILVHNREKFSNHVLTSFGSRVNEAADLSAVLNLANARPSPQPFIRRRTGTLPPRFGARVDLATLLEISAAASTLPASTPISGVTPRELSISERAVPPGAHFEPDDFHGALYKFMRPRKL
jgi:hypothetical protein